MAIAGIHAIYWGRLDPNCKYHIGVSSIPCWECKRYVHINPYENGLIWLMTVPVIWFHLDCPWHPYSVRGSAINAYEMPMGCPLWAPSHWGNPWPLACRNVQHLQHLIPFLSPQQLWLPIPRLEEIKLARKGGQYTKTRIDYYPIVVTIPWSVQQSTVSIYDSWVEVEKPNWSHWSEHWDEVRPFSNARQSCETTVIGFCRRWAAVSLSTTLRYSR